MRFVMAATCLKSIALMGMLLIAFSSQAAIDKVTSSTPISLLSPSRALVVEELLDVGILVLDDGVDLMDEEDTSLPEVRMAESVYFSSQLHRVLEKSGAWGALRVIPSNDIVVDLYVSGVIIQSDGETLNIKVKATDSSGKKWMEKQYQQRVGKYAYDRRLKKTGDPFQNLFIRIANDLLTMRETLSRKEAINLRSLSEILFAQQFSPEPFNEYTTKKAGNTSEILRLPAENDPILKRIRKIRDREYLYIDRMQEYYDEFASKMHAPYQEFRRSSYDSVVKSRQLKKQGNQRMLAGAGIILAGIYGRTQSDSGAGRLASTVGAGAGGMIVKSGLEKKQQAASYDESLAEMGSSLEATLTPQVIQLEDRTVTLTGNVEAQYQQWQELLAQIYREERGAFKNDT
ncbi:MAG: hypothetical protein CBD08_004005 [Cellvibrionales bacterium TMED148]|nr:MAG: hypothetical protein CBD08_004005 [Cellvibrionales bacterium TMED148]